MSKIKDTEIQIIGEPLSAEDLAMIESTVKELRLEQSWWGEDDSLEVFIFESDEDEDEDESKDEDCDE